MEIVHNENYFDSASSIEGAKIYFQSWAPKDKNEVKAIMLVCHGMAEHTDRYVGFGEYFAENGFAVFANDHIGHGKSLVSEDDLGYFGNNNENGDVFVADMYSLQQEAVKQYPSKPVFFFGHSMGSFIARRYASVHGEDLAGAIFCGTAGTNPAISVAKKMADTVIAKKGERYKSSAINAMSFAGNNAKTQKRTDFDWLTRDDAVVDKYIADPKCGFMFTAKGYKDMFTLLDKISSSDTYDATPTALPIFIISGTMDPVGSYGKGPLEVAGKYAMSGHFTIIKLYKDGRHEIHNELHKDETYADVLRFMNKNVG